MKRMKALQILGPEQFEIREVPVPKPGRGQVLLRVLAVTSCPHWDMHIFGGEPMFPGFELNYPYTLGQPGHEACGDIVAVGDGVDKSMIDHRVSVWIDPGHHLPGCYAQYVVKAVGHVISVPKELPPEHCAPLELAMCVSSYILFANKLDAVAGKRVGVFGLGSAGLIFVQLLHAAGASEIIGIDPLESRRKLAEKMNVHKTYHPDDEEIVNFPKRGQGGCLDTAFDCVGKTSVVHQALDITNTLVSLFAVQREPYTFKPQHWVGLSLAGAQYPTRQAAQYAADNLANGKLNMEKLVTCTMKLQEYADAVDLLKTQKAMKVAFLPQES